MISIKDRRVLSSIPIHCLSQNKPVLFGSGCFVKYKGTLFFLTAFHVVEELYQSSFILCGYGEKGAKLQSLNLSALLCSGDIKSSSVQDVDFGYQISPIKAEDCFYFSEDDNDMLNGSPRMHIESDLSDFPSTEEEYGFAGFIENNLENNPVVNSPFQILLRSKEVCQSGFRFRHTENNFLVFSKQNNDYDYSDFEGLSGAPILDSKGRLVSLVVCGGPSSDNEEWVIKGIDLTKFKLILDMVPLLNQK